MSVEKKLLLIFCLGLLCLAGTGYLLYSDAALQTALQSARLRNTIILILSGYAAALAIILLSVAVIGREFTHHRRLGRAVLDLRERLRMFTEGFNDTALFMLNPDGRIVPRTVPGSCFEVPADTVVMAIGSRPDLSFLPDGTSRIPTNPGWRVFRLQFRGGEPRIAAYMCGDCVRGPGSVVEASASGREAALNIFGDLAVEGVGRARYKDNYRRRPEPHVADRPEGRVRRGAERLSPVAARGTFHEIEARFTDRCAREEAERCARCNLSL